LAQKLTVDHCVQHDRFSALAAYAVASTRGQKLLEISPSQRAISERATPEITSVAAEILRSATMSLQGHRAPLQLTVGGDNQPFPIIEPSDNVSNHPKEIASIGRLE
jgi:hypothetical protein